MKILILGMMDTVGGIESYLYGIIKNIDTSKLHIDFLSKGVKRITYQDELACLLDECEFTFVPTYRQNPLECFRKLRAFFSTHNYDLIYLNSGFPSDILFVAPYVGKRSKIIMHSHMGQSDITSWRTICFRWLANTKADKKLACSEKAAEWFYGKREARKGDIVLVNNGIDVEKFRYSAKDRDEIRKEYGFSEDVILIGHIGRFVPQKNHAFLLDFFIEAYRNNRNLRLLLIGEGPEMENVRKIVSDNSLEKVVTLAGVRNNVWKYYSAFDMFVLPSVHEGLPVVGVEAQASGLQCLFSNRIDESVCLIDRSKMIPINDKEMWVKEILEYSIENRSGREGYADAVDAKGYNIKKTAKAINDIFSELCDGK